MKIGIIGHGADKFTREGKNRAISAIEAALKTPGVTAVVSGHSPMLGVDQWAEDLGAAVGLELHICRPKQQSWDGSYGYKARNLDIARLSDKLYVIVVDEYPPGYRGRVFPICYHCANRVEWRPSLAHKKSGACWTGWQAKAMGKPVVWIIIQNAP